MSSDSEQPEPLTAIIDGVPHVIAEDGRRWPIPSGGSTDDGGGEGGDGGGGEGGDGGDGGDGGEGPPPKGDPNALGDPGKQALDRMKAKQKEALAEAKSSKELADKFAKAFEAAGLEPGADIKSVIDEAVGEVSTTAAKRLVEAEVRVAAAGRFADPDDATKHLDLTQFDVNDDLTVDGDAISKAVNDLLESKPYLSAQGGGDGKWNGSGDQGSRKGSEDASQITDRAELKRMTPQQVRKAEAEGRLDTLLGRTA